MPLLPDPIPQPNIKQITLPNPSKNADGQDLPLDQRAWVRMDLRPIDGEDATRGIGNEDPIGAFLVRRITDWNFADTNGEKCDITYTNVLRLGQENIRYLSRQPLVSVDALTDEQKKTSISISTP